MKNIILTVFLFLLLFPIRAFANEKTPNDEINAKVTQLAAMMGDSYSHEYPDYRGIQILRNKKEDTIVAVAVFTIEGLGGGNNYTQYMAVFSALSEASEGHPKRMSLLDVMAVGGKGVRGIEFKNIRIEQLKGDIIITVPTAEYGPQDAMCCPSIKSEAQFIIHPYVGGRLKKITKRTKK
ncbi:MAG: hypothetical protein EPN94_11090 [Nitrospirae bacterium]|nr:MAG: hypothetical protein EPN94_11090 [Nitrospirota bacterium]